MSASVPKHIELARELLPLLEQHAGAAEQQRRAAEPVIQALRDAGLFKILFPKRAGGVGNPLIAHVETVAELGKADAGTAWAYGILSSITASVASMPPAITKNIFKTGDELVCSVAALTGTATETGDGYVVEGRWGYASGCMHAAWALNGVRIVDAAGQLIDTGFALLPLNAGSVTIEDTWLVAGMCASGSHTVVAKQATIPKVQVLRFSQLRATDPNAPQMEKEPRDRWPVEPLFPLGVLSPLLGAAMGIVERVGATMAKRPIIGWKYDSQAASQSFVQQFGAAAMEVESAWLHIRNAVAQIDGKAQQGPLSGFEKARIQADCGLAMVRLRRAADELTQVAGPSAFATNSPIQRLWRDLSVGSRHTALNAHLSMELYGRALLGLESNLQLLADLAH